MWLSLKNEHNIYTDIHTYMWTEEFQCCGDGGGGGTNLVFTAATGRVGVRGLSGEINVAHPLRCLDTQINECTEMQKKIFEGDFFYLLLLLLFSIVISEHRNKNIRLYVIVQRVMNNDNYKDNNNVKNLGGELLRCNVLAL